MPEAVIDSPDLAPAVLAAIADPPVDGMLLVRTTDVARRAGLREGDVLVRLGSEPTPDAAAYARARAAVTAATVDHEVVRGGATLSIPADRSCLRLSEPVELRGGSPVVARPPATEQLDVRWLARPVELHAERVVDPSAHPANARTKRGFEHHLLSTEGSTLELRSEVAFAHRADVFAASALSAMTTIPTLRLSELRWRDPIRFTEVTGAAMARRVVLEAQGPAGHTRLSHPLGPDLVPSLLVPFACCLLPRRAGAAGHVTPLPEDLYPWWEAGGSHAFFPLDALHLPKTVVCAGRAPMRARRGGEVDAWRFDAVALGRTFVTTWLDDDGAVLAIERPDHRLLPADPLIVRAGLKHLRA